MKKVLGVIGIAIAMILVSWVPESDIPKPNKPSIFEDAPWTIKMISRKTSEGVEEAQKRAEKLDCEEAERVIGEEEKNEDTANEEASEVAEEAVVVEETYEEVCEEAEEETYDEWGNNLTYLGAYDITAYEWTGNPCANGNYPTEGYTVACNSLPLGTVLYIDGIGYRTVEDRGATWHSDNWIDLYLGDVSACYEWGVRTRDVWVVY